MAFTVSGGSGEALGRRWTGGAREALRAGMAEARDLWASSRRAARVPVVLAAATVGLQVLFPLLAGRAQDVLTMVIVTLFFLASVTHAAVWRGPSFAVLLVAVTAVGGLLVESAGTRWGVPFGAYRYTDTLRPQVLGVPWVIPLAWTMMAYPALLIARRITGPGAPLAGPALAGAALAAWDLFLDPQMVAAGHWVWTEVEAAGILGIPLSNFLGWYAVATVMAAVLWPRVTVGGGADDRVPVLLYVWTWAGSTLAHLVFLGLPGSGLLGGAGMGAVVLALLRAQARDRPALGGAPARDRPARGGAPARDRRTHP